MKLQNREWEDYEEPKVGYIIDAMGGYYLSAKELVYGKQGVERAKELGIWAETEEEVKQLVEKFKAWEQLKDKGFRFKGWSGASGSNNQVIYCDFGKADAELLNLLFGGEE